MWRSCNDFTLISSRFLIRKRLKKMFTGLEEVVVVAVAEPHGLVFLCVFVCVNPMARLDCVVHSCACGCRQSKAQ